MDIFRSAAASLIVVGVVSFLNSGVEVPAEALPIVHAGLIFGAAFVLRELVELCRAGSRVILGWWAMKRDRDIR